MSNARSVISSAAIGLSQTHAHLVGVRGAGMKALAELLHDRGWSLSGSDATESRAFETELPFEVQVGHAASHVPGATAVLVYSPAVPFDNPERQQARELGVREVSYVEMLAELMRDKVGVCVAGTHGKTTTTAMVSTIMREAGTNASAIVGGGLVQYHRSGWWGTGQHLIAESCEYRRHFLEFTPQLAAILNIEPDHFDCFATVGDASDAFGAFAALIPAGGFLVVPHESEPAREAARQSAARIETFSLNSQPRVDWQAANILTVGRHTSFDVHYRGARLGRAELQVPGRHNVLNALAALALARAAGVPTETALHGLSTFRGVRRRFEIVGECRGATIIDDYAHHPTAVAATIQSARQCFGTRRLICVYQPHQISRTVGLMPEFSSCFSGADAVFFAPIYAARESTELAESTLRELTFRVNASGVASRQMTSLDHLLACVDDVLQPDDVLLVMGAGDINRIGYDLARTVS